MMKKRYRYRLSTVFGLILLAITLVLMIHLRSSNSEEKNHPNDSIVQIPSTSKLVEQLKPAIVQRKLSDSSEGETDYEALPDIIKDPEMSGLTEKEWRTLEFARELQRMLAQDEQKALQWLSKTYLGDMSFWILRDTLVLHFANKSSFIDAAESLETLRESQASTLFVASISRLLEEHAANEEPRLIWEYVTDERNHEVANHAAFFAATSMMDGKGKDHREIFDMVRSTEDPLTKRLLTNGAFEGWAQSDQKGFIDYLSKAPMNKDFTDAYEHAAFILKNENPEYALKLASKIEDPELRANTTMYAAWKLWEQDGDAFKKWWSNYSDEKTLETIKEFIEGEVLVHDYGIRK